MALLLKGAPVSAEIVEKSREAVAELKSEGISPTLAILRVGARSEDESYVRGAKKRCAEVGVDVVEKNLPEDVSSTDFFGTLEELNDDSAVHGILMLRPLPKHLDEERARCLIAPQKDIDGCTDLSLAGVFTNAPLGFPPCTAQAAIEILDHYGIECAGKNVVVIGRSLVVGRPVSLLLQHKNATVSMCHSRSKDIPALA